MGNRTTGLSLCIKYHLWELSSQPFEISLPAPGSKDSCQKMSVLPDTWGF
jgi:hypothetical protein